jgi:hypothetical protein
MVNMRMMHLMNRIKLLKEVTRRMVMRKRTRMKDGNRRKKNKKKKKGKRTREIVKGQYTNIQRKNIYIYISLQIKSYRYDQNNSDSLSFFCSY